MPKVRKTFVVAIALTCIAANAAAQSAPATKGLGSEGAPLRLGILDLRKGLGRRQLDPELGLGIDSVEKINFITDDPESAAYAAQLRQLIFSRSRKRKRWMTKNDISQVE